MYRNSRYEREKKKVDKFIDDNWELYDMIVYYIMRRIPKARHLVRSITILEGPPTEEMPYFKNVLDSYNEMENCGCCIDSIIYIYADRLKTLSVGTITKYEKYKNINKLFIQMFVGALSHEIYHILDCDELDPEELVKLRETVEKYGLDQECEDRVNNKAREFVKKHHKKLIRKILKI